MGEGTINRFVSGLRRDRLPIIVVGLFLLAAFVIRLSMGFTPLKFSSFLTNSFTMLMALFVIASVWILFRLAKDRPDSPIAYLQNAKTVQDILFRIPGILPILFAQAIFMPTFSAMKLLVGKIAPYDWDVTFIEWDVILHGDDVWRILHPVLGEAFITAFIALIYHIWILYLYLGLPLVCFWQGDPVRRQQMLVSYFLCWIVIGVALANYMASVGPFALNDIAGNDRFLPLMHYLRETGTVVPVMTLDVQDTLLRWHFLRNDGLGRGISAMPSMHVSIAALFAIFGWYVSRLIGAVLTAVLILILIGSVHLGYHYAVDGYVGILATILVWIFAGWMVRKFSSPGLGRQVSIG